MAEQTAEGPARPLLTDTTVPRGPVSWFALRTLFQSAKEDSAALKFARFADARQSQALAPAQIYDLTGQPTDPAKAWTGPYVLDYVADTGDGYDATFAVARSVDGTIYNSDGVDATEAPVGRAPLLVLGGDEVYPVASVAEYDDRLRRPFADAVKQRNGGGRLVALPGNHDWYDGLVAFRRNFCESFLRDVDRDGPPPEFLHTPVRGDALLDRTLFQSRSYWAIKLPHGWWLWGVDCQLDSYIDTAQLAYFEQAREYVGATERVIVCFPRPAWVDHRLLDTGHYLSNRETMTWFLDRMFPTEGAPGLTQVPLVLSGDKHHYTRYRMDREQARPDPSEPHLSEPQDAPRQLVTCGGGGAYLSSTHHADDRVEIPWQPPSSTLTAYHLVTAYPSRAESSRLRRKWHRIPRYNGPWFPALLAVVDLALLGAWCLLCHEHVTGGVVALVGWAVLCCVALSGFSVGFRPRHRSKGVGVALGTIHGLAHGALATGVFFAGRWLAGSSDSGFTTGLAVTLTVLVVVVASGAVFALFLLVCDSNWLHWHENEFFAGMRLDTHKSHLRITIDPPEAGHPTGRLHVTVYGIETPPRNLKDRERRSPLVAVVESFDVDEELE